MSDSEEEVLVMVEFKDSVPHSTEGTRIKMVGLETEKPIVQYEKQVFRGEWIDGIGTKVFFDESKTPESLDPAFSPNIPKQYKCVHQTSKILRLKSYVLAPKKIDSTEAQKSSSEGTTDEEDDIKEEDGLPGLKEGMQ